MNGSTTNETVYGMIRTTGGLTQQRNQTTTIRRICSRCKK